MNKKIIKDIFFLFCLLGGLFFFFLGDRPFSNPDEGRYMEIPREMVETGDWTTPHLNGLKYFEKPPLVYWMQAVVIKLFGVDEFWGRFPVALFGLLGCFLVYAFGYALYNRQAGLWAALILGTSFLYYALSRLIILDLFFTVFLTASMFLALRGLNTPSVYTFKRRFLFCAFSAMIALSFLTKGLIAGFPILILGIWLILTKKIDRIRPLYLPSQILTFLVIALPWHLLVSIKNPSFLNFYFIHEHFDRYLTTVHRRYQPFWFFLPVIIIGFFPWIFFLKDALKDFIPKKISQFKIYDTELLLLTWIGVVFGVFTFSSSKLIPYILPVFPPLSLICGRSISYIWKSKISIVKPTLFLSVSLLALIIGAWWAHESSFIPSPLWQALKLPLFCLTGSALLAGLLSALNHTRPALVILILFQAITLSVTNFAAPLIQKASLKPFAQFIQQNYGHETIVATYGRYYQDLPVYLDKKVLIIGHWGGELDFGKALEPDNQTFISEKKFHTVWQTKKPVCVVTPNDRLSELVGQLTPFKKVSTIAEIGNSTKIHLICNQ